jgi:hypothetical protein
MGLNRFANVGREVALSTLATAYLMCIWAQIMPFQGAAGAVGFAMRASATATKALRFARTAGDSSVNGQAVM